VEGTASELMAVGAHADGRLVLFALGTTPEGDREVWQREQTTPNNSWSEWKSFGRPAKEAPFKGLESLANIGWPTLVSDSKGRLLLCSLAPGAVEGKSTLFYLLGQTTPSGAEWLTGLQLIDPPPESTYHPQPAGEPPS
jgi:hypothetical protein